MRGNDEVCVVGPTEVVMSRLQSKKILVRSYMKRRTLCLAYGRQRQRTTFRGLLSHCSLSLQMTSSELYTSFTSGIGAQPSPTRRSAVCRQSMLGHGPGVSLYGAQIVSLFGANGSERRTGRTRKMRRVRSEIGGIVVAAGWERGPKFGLARGLCVTWPGGDIVTVTTGIPGLER